MDVICSVCTSQAYTITTNKISIDITEHGKVISSPSSSANKEKKGNNKILCQEYYMKKGIKKKLAANDFLGKFTCYSYPTFSGQRSASHKLN